MKNIIIKMLIGIICLACIFGAIWVFILALPWSYFGFMLIIILYMCYDIGNCLRDRGGW